MKVNKFISYTAIIGILIALGFAYSLYRKAFTPNTNFTQASVYVHIPTDATQAQIQDSLRKYVENYESLESLFLKLGQAGTIAPRRYLIENGDHNYRIVRHLRYNVPVRLTFNSPETLERLLQRIDSQVEPEIADLYQAFTDPELLIEM